MEQERKMVSKQDLESTNYDVTTVGKYDYRLEEGKKDAIFFHSLGIVCTILATICMYAFGTMEPSAMPYFLGMPLWISGSIVIYLIMFVVGMVYLAKWDEFPLTARFKKAGKNGGK